MLRAAKNENGTIIATGNDENQSGRYPEEGTQLGEWCTWTFEEFPEFQMLEGAERANRFKENAAGDGIELRTDEEVLASPNG